MYSACMIPGIYPKSVNIILIRSCIPKPSFNRTPSGGISIDNINANKFSSYFSMFPFKAYL